MPIRREDRHYYPIDWRELSAAIRFGRAKGRCERCGRPHGKTVYHLGDGRWFDDVADRWRDGRGRLVRTKTPPDPRLADDETGIARTFVHLACAHLDQDTTNNAAKKISLPFASAAISITTAPGTLRSAA